MAGNNIYVQGSYIDVHDNENVYLSVDKAEVRMGQQMAGERTEKRPVSEVLTTERAKELMTRLADADILTDQWQPRELSGAERALVARTLSDRLGIADVWQVFGSLWDEKPETLRSYFNKAYVQKKSLSFQDRIKKILG
jgi:hypothetical protein